MVSEITKESLVRTTLNKRSKVSKHFHSLFDKGIIPFPVCEIAVVGKDRDLIHYSTHNWGPSVLTDDKLIPTICLHGLNGSRLLFSDLISVVEEYFATIPIITMDFYGHGLSSAPSRKYTADMLVEEITSLLTHLKLKENRKMNIVGFSLGGAVAVAFARRFPERVNKLVLASPAGFVPFKKSKSEEVDLSQNPDISPSGGISSHVKLVKFVPSFLLNPLLKTMFKSAFKRPEPQLPPTVPLYIQEEHQLQTQRLVWQTFVKKGTVEATVSIVKNFPLFNMEKEYTAVKQSVVGKERPVLIIWGTLDGVNPLKEVAEKVKSYFTNSFILRVQDAGHVVISEQPSLVVSSIVSFLQASSDFKFYK